MSTPRPALGSPLDAGVDVSVQGNAVAELMRIAPVADRLAELFTEAGHELFLVGGSVRDALLGRLGSDLDFTTSARPDDVEALLRPPSAPTRTPSTAASRRWCSATPSRATWSAATSP